MGWSPRYTRGGLHDAWSLANFQAVFGNLTGEVARPTLWRGRPRPRSRRFSAGLTIPDRPRPGGPG